MVYKKIERWAPELELVEPIDVNQIPKFTTWVDYKGFSIGHEGFVFASYLDPNGICYLGLPPNLEVRAVMGGIVSHVRKSAFAYSNEVGIEHGEPNMGVRSIYCHVNPLVEVGDEVELGQLIGTFVYQEKKGIHQNN